MTDKFYSTKEVLKKVGVSRNTLFLWFKQGKVPEVRRDRNGYRVFNDRDIEVILAFKNKIVPFKDLKHGFTLVELMIASALLVVIMGTFLLSFNTTLKNANYSEGMSFARRACQSKLEEMLNHTYDNILVDYAAAGNPGNVFPFNTSDFVGNGSIAIAQRDDLYQGLESCVTAAAPWAARSGHSSLVYDNKMWVMGGWDSSAVRLNDVWYSTDGANWTLAIDHAGWSARVSHASIVYDNKMWVMGGDNGSLINDVWYSNNGKDWIRATAAAGWSPRFDHGAIVYDNKMWVIAGAYTAGGAAENDVWYSTDGVNWIRATFNPLPWTPRFDHALLVYNNRMWLMGGNGGGLRRDVWSSTDGVNWALATANAAWSPRMELTAVVYSNKMWVMGGDNGSPTNDVWYSANGVNWNRATAAASWSARTGQTSVVYDDKMWVIGGTGASGVKNDVWSSAGYNRLLEVLITASWRHHDGRTFGEDRNLNGVLDAGEDVNGDGNLSSPAQLRAFISDRESINTVKTYLGKP